jgi:uncharacterized membrane-anchored protein YitT (DUF2179 family)
MVTAGTAGLALTLSYAVHMPLGLLFLVINIPFFLFALRVMGVSVTLKSILVNLLISAGAQMGPNVLHIAWVRPEFAAFGAGTLIGMAALALARHGAGVGGTGLLALWLHKRNGWNAGTVALSFDVVVLAIASTVIPVRPIIWSALSIFAIHGVMFTWHRPGRYAVS